MTFGPIEVAFIVCVSVFTLVAAICDTRTRKVPNRLTVPALVGGIIFRLVADGTPGLGEAGLGFVIGFGTLFVLWAVGGGGGGDVKLMGALGVWLGFKATLAVLICSAFISLMVTIVVWFAALFRSKRSSSEHQKHTIAYALPIALATWLVVSLQATSVIGNLLAI